MQEHLLRATHVKVRGLWLRGIGDVGAVQEHRHRKSLIVSRKELLRDGLAVGIDGHLGWRRKLLLEAIQVVKVHRHVRGEDHRDDGLAHLGSLLSLELRKNICLGLRLE